MVPVVEVVDEEDVAADEEVVAADEEDVAADEEVVAPAVVDEVLVVVAEAVEDVVDGAPFVVTLTAVSFTQFTMLAIPTG